MIKQFIIYERKDRGEVHNKYKNITHKYGGNHIFYSKGLTIVCKNFIGRFLCH